MYLLLDLILTLSYFFGPSKAQTLLYTDRRRSDLSYNQPVSVSPFSILNPYTGFSYKNVILPSYKDTIRNYESTSLKENYRSSFYPSYHSYSNKKISSSSPNKNNFKRGSSSNKDVKEGISKADAENAKFLGAENQENDYDSRILRLKYKKFHRRFNRGLMNPCLLYGRDASNSITPPPKEQGRFLWDINVHNYYSPSPHGLGCGGYGGFGSSGLLSDPIAPAYYPPGTSIANFLRLFAPGILQSSLAVPVRPQQYADYSQTVTENYLQSDPEVDPNYRPGSVSIPVKKPNVVFYDSVGAPPATPAQLVGGISATVNGIIQQLTGNVQPVYG